MNYLLFLALLGAFILNVIFPSTGGGIIGLNITNVAIYLVGLVLILTNVLGGRITKKKFVGAGFAIMISIAVFLSLFYAQFFDIYGGSFLDNFRKAKSFVFMPALLYVLAFLLIDAREQGERYLLLLVLMLGVMNLASAIGSYFGVEFFRVNVTYEIEEETKRRLVGFTGNPNKTAYLTCVLIVFQYYFYKFHKSHLVRNLMAIIMAGGVVVVLLSGSRGGLLVLLAAIIYLAYRLRDMRVVYGAILAIPFLIGILLFTESTLLSNAIERLGTLTSEDKTVVMSGRNLIWSSLLTDYTNSFIGILFGNGFGAAKYMGIGAEPHNIYLRVLVEFGIIGLGFFIYFILSMFRSVHRTQLDREGALGASVLASGYVIVFAWFFTTLVGVLYIIWFVVGIAMATMLNPGMKSIQRAQSEDHCNQ